MFWMLITVLTAQRAAEMAVARRNEQKVKKQGAIEFGEGHYPYIITMHILFSVFNCRSTIAAQTAFKLVVRHSSGYISSTGDSILGALFLGGILEYKNSCCSGC